ncbi:MAG: iron ABC transporter substrate-binding protein [Deltaproteobacteria bacterium]|nr:iron ABC transporter substrate-binding protein [Deltaproteobacteria bacterium]
MKRFTLIILFFISTMSITTASASSLTVIDMADRKVDVPFDPARIICIGPGTLRLIVYLNAQDKISGVEDMEKSNSVGRPYWIANPELQDLPRCGPGGPTSINKKPDLEAVMSVSPDVIFVTYMDRDLADEVQATLGIPIVVLSYGTFSNFDETVFSSLKLAGKILNRERRAEDLVSYITSLKKDLNDRTANIPASKMPRVFVGGIGYRGSYGIESTEKDYIPLEWLNAINLAEQVEGRIGDHVLVDKETMLKLDPDVIFIDGGGLALVEEDYNKKKDFYKALKAVKNRQVFMLFPFNWYTTNIETAMADAYAIGKILYGERFKDIDPEKKADEIYTFMVGKPVYKDMEKDHGKLGVIAPFLK